MAIANYRRSLLVFVAWSFVVLSRLPTLTYSTDSSTSPISSSDTLYIDDFLRRMSSTRPDNCSMEILGPGVVQGFARERFKRQALIAVTRANLLTYLWKYNPDYLYRESVLYWLVSSFVESDDDIFAAGNCYDFNQFKSFGIFCPYAFRNKKDGTIVVKDLAKTHHYENEQSTEHEWFHEIRRIGQRIINNTKSRKESVVNFFLPNEETNKTYSTLVVNYDDGHWSMPYYDCGGGNIWMITYTVPFFGYDRLKRSYSFKGSSGIDIDLMQVDINQCPASQSDQTTSAAAGDFNAFANTHKCKPTTTCVPIAGLGFHRGSYKCFCRDGFYLPLQDRRHYDETMKNFYYNGSEIEEDFDRKERNSPDSTYDISYECLPCATGCGTCEDERPCLYPINWILRITLLSVTGLVMLSIIGWSILVRMFQDFKAIKAASPLLLQIILAGALISYLPMIVHFFEPDPVLCTLQFWPREIGFAFIYASILFKTWRIAVVFRPTKYRNVKITDIMLLRRIAMVVSASAGFCAVRTILGRPEVVMVRHSSGMKTYTCNFDAWDFSADICKLLFLIWGIWLSILVRKTPSEFNESRFISWAIYNETIMTVFFNISMFFLHSSGNPDLFYVLIFLQSQLTVTGTIAFLFASKAYHLIRSMRAGELPGPTQKRNRFVPTLSPRMSSTVTTNASNAKKRCSMMSTTAVDFPSCDYTSNLAAEPTSDTDARRPSCIRNEQPSFTEFTKKKDLLEVPKIAEAKEERTPEEENLLIPCSMKLQEQFGNILDEGSRMTPPKMPSSLVKTNSIKDQARSTSFDARLSVANNHVVVAKSTEVRLLSLDGSDTGVTSSTSRSDSPCKSPSSSAGTNTLSSTRSSKTTEDTSVGNKPSDHDSSSLAPPENPAPDSAPQLPAKLGNGAVTKSVDLLLLHDESSVEQALSVKQATTDDIANISTNNRVRPENGCSTTDESVVSLEDPSALTIKHRGNAIGATNVWVKINGKVPMKAQLPPKSTPTKSKPQQVANPEESGNVVSCMQFTYV